MSSGLGVLEFRFLKNGNEQLVLAPEKDKCTEKLARVLGPQVPVQKALDSRKSPQFKDAQNQKGCKLRLTLPATKPQTQHLPPSFRLFVSRRACEAAGP